MIRWRNVLQIVGFFVLALAASLGLVVLFALFYDDAGFDSLVLATLIAVGLGGFLCLAFRCLPRSHHEAIEGSPFASWCDRGSHRAALRKSDHSPWRCRHPGGGPGHLLLFGTLGART